MVLTVTVATLVPEFSYRGLGDEVWSEGSTGVVVVRNDLFKIVFVLQIHIFYLDCIFIWVA